MSFHVGQKVVCIDDKFTFFSKLSVTLPRAQSIYCIREIVLGFGKTGFAPGLLLEEIRNAIGPLGTEYNFNPRRFRPIVSRKTDISALTALLVPGSKIRETA